MKKLLFPLFAVLIFAACQSDSGAKTDTSAAADNASTQPATGVTQDVAVQAKETVAKAESSQETIKKIATEIDALSDNVKKKNEVQINEMRNMVEALTEKQAMIIGILNGKSPGRDGSAPTGTDEGAAPALDPSMVKDLTNNIELYQKEIEKLQMQIKELSEKQ
ncbi:MAG: hypothetical protein IPK76_08910 [Lewinellaceae bacterium]|jgi:peptidoglycan hydrolase CwlO-like protein|nr:hypothetical protein [Lewinellaceae bacterium]